MNWQPLTGSVDKGWWWNGKRLKAQPLADGPDVGKHLCHVLFPDGSVLSNVTATCLRRVKVTNYVRTTRYHLTLPLEIRGLTVKVPLSQFPEVKYVFPDLE